MLLSARKNKIVSPDRLEEVCKEIKAQGKTLVTLNGSFDLLHVGHLDMITKAAGQGDILLMLLNTDASIQAYKSTNRPINPLKERLEMIAALEAVDLVSYFAELDPIATLEKVRPHVHVNGSEYGENCIEAEVVKKYGGRIHVVDLLPGYSSTNLIKKIRMLCES